MDFYVYDKNLDIVGIIDSYTSAIWTLRYNAAGDFEIYIKSTPEILKICQIDNYVLRDSDNTAMIIKSIQQAESVENGDYITISGVSVENILSQRVVWERTTLSGRVEECALTLINDSFINPIVAARKIPNIKTTLKHLPAEITMTDFSNQNVYDAVKTLCDIGKYGFRMIFDGEYFIFEIYSGTDHSKNQTTNDYIIFDTDNLAETIMTNDNNTYKNVALVGGAGENLLKQYTSYGDAAGINRYETFVDAGSVSGTSLLKSAGRDALYEKTPTKTFDSEISTYYTYGVDYALGDIVQVETKTGVTATARITEIIQSIDDSGIYTIPTFSEWGLNDD